MATVAFWLAFISSLPVMYWVWRLFIEQLRFKLSSKHIIDVEYIDAQGTSHSERVEVSSDKEFYAVAMAAIRSGRTVKSAAGNER